MNKFTFNEKEEFYPTPDELLKKVLDGVDWKKVHNVLEPSAGKGNIVDYILRVAGEYPHYNRQIKVDCIEKDADLQKLLRGKNYRVIHDDFLTFHTQKTYDLVIMNPPFSNGGAHLLKALDVIKYGGNIICILNAETIKNPYSNERKMLLNKLDELGADICFYAEEFVAAERTTSVEIAVVKVAVPEKEIDSKIFADLQRKYYAEVKETEQTDVAVADYIKAAVTQFNIEVEAGISLIREYYAMKPKILSSLKNTAYNSPILSLKIGSESASINQYVESVRAKYWNALFKDERFTGKMTAEMQTTYNSQVNELKNYDFSYYNIMSLQEDMTKNLVTGIEECIILLFDELSHQYSYNNSEYEKNVHYYNGWCTNKSWYINKKVILPFYYAWSRYFDNKFQPDDYECLQKLGDIEKALNYLDGGLTNGVNLQNAMQWAKATNTTKKIPCKYFNVTFYKKGTMHIEFTNEELLKKLNIFGSQQKKWLPPAYGKKTYAEMDEMERAVVDEFEGEISYKKTLENADYYLYNPEHSVKMLETA